VSYAGPNVPATIPSPCCAIPFTLNGDVYYGCTDDGEGVGCFYGDRVWKLCQLPAGTSNKPLTVTISRLVSMITFCSATLLQKEDCRKR